MIKEVDLVSYLPPFMQEYKALAQTLEAENPEFALLWEAAGRVRKNAFVATADEYGIGRFERILGIFPDKGETLEERRTKLLMKYNLRLPYTLSFLKSMLDSAIGGENYTIERLYEIYQLKICIINQDICQVGNIYDVIEGLLPGNMKLSLYAEYREAVKAEIKQAMSVTFISAFYPRMNIPTLFLNGTWELDGSQTLSGYDSIEQIDICPVKMEIQTRIEGTPEEKTAVSFFTGVRERIESSQEVEVRGLTECQEAVEESFTIQTSAKTGSRAVDVLVDNLNILDGEWELDGSRELDGGLYIL